MNKKLESQLKTLERGLKTLRAQAKKGRGQAQRQLMRLERQTRATVTRALRNAEPLVRKAVAEAAVIGRGLQAGVKAGVAAYRERARRR